MPDAISTREGDGAHKAAAARGSAEHARPDATGWSWPRFFRNAAVVAAAVALGTWYVVDGVIPNVVPKRFGVVEPGVLYRSGELTPAATRRVVERHGIRTIIDLGADSAGSADEARARDTAAALGAAWHRFSLRGDGRGDPNEYVGALRIAMDPANQPVLIHCAAGSQRTTCAIGMFRIINDGWTVDRVIDDAAAYDHDPVDNPHVKAMLERWTDDVRASLETGSSIETGRD